MYIVFHSNFAAYIVCRSYKRCKFLGFVWTDCRGNKSYYVITSPANCSESDIGIKWAIIYIVKQFCLFVSNVIFSVVLAVRIHDAEVSSVQCQRFKNINIILIIPYPSIKYTRHHSYVNCACHQHAPFIRELCMSSACVILCNQQYGILTCLRSLIHSTFST